MCRSDSGIWKTGARIDQQFVIAITHLIFKTTISAEEGFSSTNQKITKKTYNSQDSHVVTHHTTN
ncbi:hypothetical protein N7507_009694 [Penicillium longicatenatum]|nr:hypothetical protein N7507_009694 [Penicillium longicatenatum]